MFILALDTTTSAGSVALVEGVRVLEVAPIDPSQPVATRVPGDLALLLERHHVSLRQIDLFAVATGPGSFTGLRIGIATMQGLAFAQQKPLIGVSAFEAMASLVDAPRVGVWIDAWRGEVYAAMFARSGDRTLEMTEPPTVDTPDALLARSASASTLATTTYIGDAAMKYRDRLARVVEPTPLLAGALASLANIRAEAGEQIGRAHV